MTLAKSYRAFCLTFFIFTQQGLAQSPAEPGRKTPATSVKPAATKADSRTSKKGPDIFRVRGFADRLLSLQDVKTKSIAVARLADLLWPSDEAYARNLFQTAIGFCSPASDAPESEVSALVRIQAEIISMVERRDAKFAKQLAQSAEPAEKGAGASERSRVDFYNAFGLIKSDPKEAVNLVERSASSGIPPFMQSFLIMLRLKDEAAADSLFLRVLDQLVANPGEDADTLLRLGAYVFTSPKIDTRDSNVPPDTVTMVGVGNVLVPDLTANRPNVPPHIVRAYLKAAADVLSREAANPARSPSFYVAGRMLLPKYDQYAPELAPLINSLMESLGANVSPQLRQDSAYEGLKAEAPQSPDEVLKNIENEVDAQRRDEQYLALVSDLLERAEFAKARAVAANVSDGDARTELTNLIDFREAAVKLERPGGMAGAEGVATRLPDGLERAMLWLGIVRGYAKAGNSQRALLSANALLASVRKINDARRPYLLLCAAGQLARFDPELAKVTLVEAVHEFNEQKAESLEGVEWMERVEVGVLSREFPIGVKGILCDFGQALPPLLEVDTEGTVAQVENLRTERPLAEALLTTAAVLLKPSARSPSPPDSAHASSSSTSN
jgi:hypothetical protein